MSSVSAGSSESLPLLLLPPIDTSSPLSSQSYTEEDAPQGQPRLLTLAPPLNNLGESHSPYPGSLRVSPGKRDGGLVFGELGSYLTLLGIIVST